MSNSHQLAPEDHVWTVYRSAEQRVHRARARLGRPLTLTEKIIAAHRIDATVDSKSSQSLFPDRVVMPDSTAQMVLLQFITSGLPRVAIPASVHCDHLVRASTGAESDLRSAREDNAEVYEFLRLGCAKYGIDFWEPGSGITHQVFLQHYAFPGGMLLGTDSHTPMAGGLGMLGIGVGGVDAVDGLAGRPLTLPAQQVIGVRLTGKTDGWTTAKDVILALAGLLTVKGATGCVIEYFGPGVESLSATGRATICNMGAEVGATSSLFPYDSESAEYLRSIGRDAVADLADQYSDCLRADLETAETPECYYDRVIDFDLDTLEPHVTGPHSPDRTRGLSQLARAAADSGYQAVLSQAFIGSCTNSSYEDLGRAADLARQAHAAGLRLRTGLLVAPGSETVRAAAERDGLLADLMAVGAEVLANACGPCIGQWRRSDGLGSTPNVIISSFNRNFPRRNDGHAETMALLASPDVVMALALAGRIDFDPRRDALPGGLRLRAPRAARAPERGYGDGWEHCQKPRTSDSIVVEVAPDSERLQMLRPFPAWDGHDLLEMPVLFKARGKCTTDHISPAGPWLRYRGHLERISRNTFLGVTNAFSDAVGHGLHHVTGATGTLPDIARDYRDRGTNWVAVGDDNYGEGSSREHAAMQPRYLGCRAVLARGFARIHEANLKSQGILPLTFVDPADYERIQIKDRISVTGLADLNPDDPVLAVVLHHPDSTVEKFPMRHTLTTEQIGWFQAGSSMNALRQAVAAVAQAEDAGA